MIFVDTNFFKTPGLKILSHTNYQPYSVYMYVRECVVRRVWCVCMCGCVHEKTKRKPLLTGPLSPPRSKQLNEVLEQGTPFTHWEEPTIIAWLELWVGMPYWYIAAIRSCLQNGAMLEVSVYEQSYLPEIWQA